ncbi:MAG TPA: type II secretion system F family protein [Methylomirabilota bacterium]|nr:type II secretion system F family protein [Methylomirabilota bacterium]
MDALSSALIAFVVVAGSTFLSGALLLRWWPALRRERLMAPTPESGTATILRWQTAQAGWQRVVERLGRLAGSDGTRLSKHRERLAWAGYHDPRAVLVFRGVKVAMALALGVAYPLVGIVAQRVAPNLLLYSVMFGTAGFFMPNLWLYRRAKARQEDVVNALPDMLDLLTVCVEGGMGFDAALSRVAEQPEAKNSALHQELRRMIQEMRAGRPRQEALRALADRCGVQEVNAMVSVFIQTDRLGTSMGKTLRVHADSSRIERRHRAEARAYVAPLKMIFPTALFLMPAFMLVAMGPSLLKIMAALSRAGR